jgi:hypothetical protein
MELGKLPCQAEEQPRFSADHLQHGRSIDSFVNNSLPTIDGHHIDHFWSWERLENDYPIDIRFMLDPI